MWFAREKRGLLGSVQLELCSESDGLNRAIFKSLLINRHAHRHGIDKQLTAAIEKAAIAYHRDLLCHTRRSILSCSKLSISGWVT